jgi:adenine-specific DNA-methyltransferase
MPVELIWDGKYDADGRKRAPLRIALPFQTVETINESVQERQRSLDQMFSREDGRGEWRNRLIWGDKKWVLPSLLEEFAGKVNLIYIDPPFATGDDFSFQVQVDGEEFTKEPSIIETMAYRDTWGRGLDGYLQWFYETTVLLRELLANDGSLYAHLDWHIGHYAKVVLDEVFGSDRFLNEITWKRTSGHSDSSRYGNSHDIILYYSRSEEKVWNDPYQEYDKDYVDTYYRYEDPNGRKWMSGDLGAAGLKGGGYDYVWKGFRRVWRLPETSMQRLDVEGKIYYTKSGIPRIKRYFDESKGIPAQDIWADIESLRSWHAERVNYPTQKPEALLERIIKASSNEGDLVLDCFCGSGTTAAVAEKLNRRWITCDLGRFAIHTARKRLLGIPNVKPFVVQNLGKYERQAWQKHQFGDDAMERVDAYIAFILKLYRAQPLSGFTWLQGIRAGRAVHVGAVDSPVTLADVKGIVIDWKKNVGKTSEVTSTGVDVLGWEFALELHETAKQQAAEAGVDLRFLTIPREVLEQKAVEQGDIQFYELAALFVNQKVQKRKLTLELTNFIAPLEYVPQEVRERVTKWQSWIDYWAVDWDFKGDTFHNQWQSYRTRKDKNIKTSAEHAYEEAGDYLVQVKVIDILGNDTTRTLKVQVK